MILNEHSFNLAMRYGLQTKDRIERAALRLFVAQGVAETSIRDIAAAAGVSQGAMYNHYTSKDELAFALFAESWAEMGQELRRCAQMGDTLEDKFRSMVGYVFGLFDEDWIRVRYVFFARHENLMKMAANVPNPYLVFRTVIVEAMKRGEIPHKDADLANSMVMGAIVQVIDTKILGRIKSNLSAKTETVAKACAAMLQS